MEIKLKIKEAAESRGIDTQIQLAQEIEKKTGVTLRAATISDMYRNKQDAISKKNLLLIMQGLGTTDFNDVLSIEE